VFDFIKDELVVATLRFSWDHYLDFTDQIADWFFDCGATMRFMSPLDTGMQIECMAHGNYTASMIFGVGKIEVVFCVARADFLALMDNVSIVVEALVPEDTPAIVAADIAPDRRLH
jgi:hypothetical protein